MLILTRSTAMLAIKHGVGDSAVPAGTGRSVHAMGLQRGHGRSLPR
jgi:hypothetical protein